MSIATIGDNLIHYEVLGRGEPLIFIHGWLGSWRYWWPSMQALSKRHRTFAFDLWGYGDSSKSTDKYRLESYVEMLDQFTDKLGMLKQVNLVGHSLGGAVALKFASRHPEKVKRVAAVSLPVQGNAIHDRLLSWDPATIMSRVLGQSYPEVDVELRKTDPAALNHLAQELSQIDFVKEIQSLDNLDKNDQRQIPLLLVFGNQDPVVRQPTDILPEPTNSRAYISLDGCTHFPMLEQAMKFNRLVLDFTHTEGSLQEIAPKEHWQRRTR